MMRQHTEANLTLPPLGFNLHGAPEIMQNELVRSNTLESPSPNPMNKNSSTPIAALDKHGVHCLPATTNRDSNLLLVPFIRVEKHMPSRKNMKGQLIYCNEETTDDYKFSKYLEEHRYSRLFVEKELLGEGGFGKVFLVEHVLDQR